MKQHIQEWNEAIMFFWSHGIDLRDMTYRVQDTPVYNDGRPALDINPLTSAGSRTKLGYVVIASTEHLKKVQEHYGVDELTVKQFAKLIAVHELAHEAWNRNPQLHGHYKANRNRFSPYLKSLPAGHRKYESGEEYYAEFMANKALGYPYGTGEVRKVDGWEVGRMSTEEVQELLASDDVVFKL